MLTISLNKELPAAMRPRRIAVAGDRQVRSLIPNNARETGSPLAAERTFLRPKKTKRS